MTDLVPFERVTAADADAVGGKGQSLGLMATAGLPVPPGFCITSAAHRRLGRAGVRADAALTGQIAEAYRGLGGGAVAVRSSATAEDGAAASFAGQQETVLGVTGEDAVLDAVARCWASLDGDRAVAYRRRQGIADDGLAMAVVVQRLIDAQVAGVLFTCDPLDAAGRQMLVEASWGLGESVVSGRVSPDRFQLDRETGTVVDRQIGTKTTRWTADGPVPVPPEMQARPCMSDAQLAELAALGRRVEAFYGGARDVEWAFADGRFWLLQARPITAGAAAEREQVRREEIDMLVRLAEPGGTVWARYNLAEILPEPTPMTWAIVRRFMSGQGGFGLMYRDLAFDPDPLLDDVGIFDLVCGRPYCNLSREPRMQSRRLPFEHPFGALKASPQKALYPQPVLNPARAGLGFWLRLPLLTWGLVRAGVQRNRLAVSFASDFRERIVPAYLQAVARAAEPDPDQQDGPALVERLEALIRLTLVDFARDSLKPTALAGLALGNLERMVQKPLGPERTRAALGELTMGVRPEPDADLAGAVADLAAGPLTRDAFLKRFGHRGSLEMELAQPRWAEDPAAVDRLVAGSGRAKETAPETGAWPRISDEARLAGPQRAALESELRTLHTYLGLREAGKHYLLLGYAQIRRVLLALDRRYRLGGGVFYLTPDELPRLAAGEAVGDLVAGRRRRRALALSLEVPQVLFSDDLQAIGRPVPVEGSDVLKGTPLSAGVAEGPVLVLTDPDTPAPEEPYILVCPSTDPAWVPLFARAKGLIMETGGVLSHGAIVAREFGLPAVAGLPDVQRRLKTGQHVRVDGGSGAVVVLASGANHP